MTKKEYEKICEIIDKSTKDVWVSPYYCKNYNPSENIPEIKKKIKEHVK